MDRLFKKWKNIIEATELSSIGKTYLRLDKRKDEAGEFVVKSYKNGKLDEDDCYYTDDWEDALGTFKVKAKKDGYSITKESPTSMKAEKNKVEKSCLLLK